MTINIDIREVPLAPKNPLAFRQRLKAARRFDTGPEALRDAGGPVTRNVLGPDWLMPPLVFITSPRGAREILGRTDDVVERGATPMSRELRRLSGDNLLGLRAPTGCRGGARCSRSSPNSACLPSPATWPKPPNSYPSNGAGGPKSTSTPHAAR